MIHFRTRSNDDIWLNPYHISAVIRISRHEEDQDDQSEIVLISGERITIEADPVLILKTLKAAQ